MLSNDKLIAQLRTGFAGHRPQSAAGDFPEAAVLVAISCAGGGEPAVLLTTRASHLKLHPGEVAFPGGKQDPEDKSLLDTALREAQEEVALAADQFEYLGTLSQRITLSNIRITPFVGFIPGIESLQPNRDELDDLFLLPLRFFMTAENLQVDRHDYCGSPRYIARFDYQQHTVWGATAGILVDLVNSIFGCNLWVGPTGEKETR